MSEILQKIKVFYDRIRIRTGSYAGESVRVTHDWRFFLSFTFIALILSGAFAFYFYTQIDQGKFFILKKNDTKKDVKIDALVLKRVMDDINLRQATLSEIKQNKAIPGDPSN